MEIYLAPPAIIETSTGEDNDSTIYFNPFVFFRNTEEFKLIKRFLESRTPKHKIDGFFNQDFAKTFNPSTINSTYNMDLTIDSMCGGLPQ